MFKKLFLSSFLVLGLFGFIYPIKKEKTKLFNYCYSLEKMLSRNSLKRSGNVPNGVKSITKKVLKFGVSKTRGALINNAIDQYKISKNIFIINLIPNKSYCLIGYWIEEVRPGMFESLLVDKSKEKIDELNDMKDKLDLFLRDINSEYESLKKDFNDIF